MDCFFVAIEMRDNPRLDPSQPIAVGGRPGGRGVISTCNYPARKYGVRSAMSTHEAIRRCPHLIFAPSHYDSYKKEGYAVREIFKDYTDLIEPLSLDEAYLDVTECSQHQGSATKIAQEIRQRIFKQRKLTASAGIAPNKFLAKIASEWNKPNGQKTITPDKVQNFLLDLPVGKINGVGKATQRKLHKLELFTCGDIQKKDISFLTHHFGQWGLRLFELSFGRDNRPVKTDRIRKSLSVERTFSDDLNQWKDIRQKFLGVFDNFIDRWEKAKIDPARIKSCQIKVKYFDFQSITREQQTDKIPDRDLWLQKMKAIHEENPKAIRLLGLGVKLDSPKKPSKNKVQLNLFETV